MKKTLALVLVMVLALSLLTACGGGNNSNAPSGDGENSQDATGKINLTDVADSLIEEAKEHNSFSLAAAEAFWKAAGVDVNAVAPDWDWIVNEERMATYGDKLDAAYGHANILFEKSDGSEVTEDDIKAFAQKMFEATAAASDDGHNIIGWDFVSEGEDALSEVSFEKAFAGWLCGWGFMKNGRNMVCYIGDAYDRNKDSQIGALLYYYGVSADIAYGMEKSMDDLWQDMEDAFEEYGDEIQDALKN